MRNEALVVIDMQDTFLKGCPKTRIDYVCRALREAKKRDMPVFIVSYRDFGETNSRVLAAAEKHTEVTYIEKSSINGSRSLLSSIKQIEKRRKLPRGFSSLRFCGAWTSQCVKETILGVVKKRPKTSVVLLAQGCWDPKGSDHGLYWTKRQPHANLLVA